jgi:2-isopropylmalate synthase
MSEKIIIFDTTLRDGEQSPGASLGAEAKLKLARQLAKLKVDVIEAGFPASSPGDLRSVRAIAKRTKGPIIAALARCIKRDIDLAVQALEPAAKKRLHIFLATSAIHRKYKLRKAKQEILRLAVESVKYGRRFCDDVEFSPEDASRTEPDYLCQVVEAVIEAGATVVNIPDTVGYATPVEFGRLIAAIKSCVPNIRETVLSIHCHDDLGLATSNSLSALENGARQVECTINGIGERAGNASLEEIVMILKTREDYFGFSTGIKTEEIHKTSRLVTTLTGIHVQPNKAIVGDNAFKHEAGIHQDGVLKEKRTYEIMSPETIGLKESRLVLGKHSGRHAFGKRLEEVGYKLSEKDMQKAFERFKRLADKKKEIYDEDLTAIIEDEISTVPETFKLVYVHTTSGSQTVPTATVRVKKEGKIFQDAACGDGPVDAAYKTIDKITGLGAELVDYSLRAVTSGKDALGEVTVKIRKGERVVTGRGTSTDIIEASAKAYVNAANKIVRRGSSLAL